MAQEFTKEEAIQPVPLKINWRPAEDIPVHFGNQFLLQYVGDGYILSFGQVTPPAIIGPTAEDIDQIPEVPVHVLGRVSMSAERTKALLFLLQRQLEKFHPELLKEPADGQGLEEEPPR